MHVSLCFLSYNRPDRLLRAVQTGVHNAGVPVEVIIHDDGSSVDVQRSIFNNGTIADCASLLMLGPPEHNEGVGRAINRCFSVSTGDYLCKLDQDLKFEPDWLKDAISVLDADHHVGMVGLFKYEHDPADWRKMCLEDGTHSNVDAPGYHYVRDFVSSAFVIPRDVYEALGPLPEYSDAFAEDIEYKKRIVHELGLRLALLDEDVVHNEGFGIGPDRSTVVNSDGSVHKIHHGPLIS